MGFNLVQYFVSFNRQNQTREQKDAEAYRKASKRAAEKIEKEQRALKRLALTNEGWIFSWLSELAFDVPKKSNQIKARRRNNAKAQAKLKSNQTNSQRKERLARESKAQAKRRSLETKNEHEARLSY